MLVRFICSVLGGNTCGDFGIRLQFVNPDDDNAGGENKTEVDVCYQVKFGPNRMTKAV